MKFSSSSSILRLPILPVRDRVVFPHLATSLVAGRERSIQAMKSAASGNHQLFVVTQRHPKVEDPLLSDLYDVGVISDVEQMMTLPDGLTRVRLKSRERGRLVDLRMEEGLLRGDIQPLRAQPVPHPSDEMEALRRVTSTKFNDYVQKTGRIPVETVTAVGNAESLPEFCDRIADALLVPLQEKQDLLELLDVRQRLERLIMVLDSEGHILSLEQKIHSRVQKQIEKNQREYYLNEQMRAIQKELRKKDDHARDADGFRSKIKEAKMPAEAEDLALKEADRLERMMPFSPEATVVRSYLEWMTGLPWSASTEDNANVIEARRILNEDHFGLEKPKERLLEYLAVLKLTKVIKGPVLCFVGPPGVGKTSLAKSLARALGRQFVRIALGGVRDESEIRGHRRTYIGSMPGRVIQALKRAKTNNPVILLDEIDKMGSDWRGDPAAALLEVLDPEQNKLFGDHYLDTGFDLSKVIFITTANSLYTIPATLQDRMEVIRFSAYTTDEKIAIARSFLFPRELKEHGLPPKAVTVEEEAMRHIVHSYTQEAGVRDLQRKIAQLCRKIAVEWVSQPHPKSKAFAGNTVIALKDLNRYLGIPEYQSEKISVNAVGISTGLAWTDHGGDVLTVEVTTLPGGKGKVTLTGKLGAVMQESAQAAMSLVRSRAGKMGVRPGLFQKTDVHIHVPQGAVPKDGPSAGITMATALMSAFSGRPVRKNVAMTGEVTLRGRVLPIGGLKEKTLAAFREGVTEVLFPKGNEKDIPDIPENVRAAVRMTPVESIDDVFRLALQSAGTKAISTARKWDRALSSIPD